MSTEEDLTCWLVGLVAMCATAYSCAANRAVGGTQERSDRRRRAPRVVGCSKDPAQWYAGNVAKLAAVWSPAAGGVCEVDTYDCDERG